MLYDALLVVALLMVVTGALLPFTGGEAVLPDRHGPAEHLYRALLVAIVVGFFGLFWTRQGQTLGMRAWRLKVIREDGSLLSWADTLMRLGAALVSWAVVGLGYVWIWIDRDRLAWHDRWTRTRVIVLPKR